MNQRPKCQDGRSCNGEGEAFMIVQFESGRKAICGKCFLQAQKEANDFRYKETLREILKEEGKI